jgi:chromosome segregation ATPase
MDRKRSETALRCLEIALHPKTDDKEAIAAIHAFRRTAAGASLRQIYARLSGGDASSARRDQPLVWRRIIDRLSRENREFRNRLETHAKTDAALAARLCQAEQRAFDLSEKLAAAQRSAVEAERERAELKSALVAICQQNNGLRTALDHSTRSEPSVKLATPPFRALLAAAQSRAPESFAGGQSASAPRLPDASNAPGFAGSASHPWVA